MAVSMAVSMAVRMAVQEVTSRGEVDGGDREMILKTPKR